MTRDEAVAYIKQGLGFRTGNSAEVLLKLDLVQQHELERGVSFPDWLITYDAPLVGAADVAYTTAQLPATFIRQVDDGVRMSDVDGATRFLRKMPWKEFTELGQNSEGEQTTGIPYVYTLRDRRIYVRPVPEVDWTVYVTYYAHDTLPSALTGVQTNQWLTYGPLGLVNLAGVRMAEDLRDDAALKLFSGRMAADLGRQTSEAADGDVADAGLYMGELS